MTRGGNENAAGDRAPSIGGQGANTAAGAEQAGASPSGPNPVYRRSFVGREAELRQLEQAFDAAVSGQGGLVMVVGEPGIGKTTLTEQLSTYASLRGGRTLVGHCYEEGSLSLPYLPFVEAMRSYVLEREPELLKSDLGSSAAEVARIVSEVRDRVLLDAQPASGDAGEDRYRLLNGVTSFLRNAAAVKPLVVVVEDLHDADRGTLDMLTFLARRLADSRLLVVGSYRDVEVDRAHPLSSTLAELRRGGNFSRVLLRGLTVDEVQRMIAAIAGQEVQWTLAETVHRQTEGNPLFVQEVVRYLAESGMVRREDGRWQAASPESLLTSIPEGLRDVIGRRLSHLSADCNRLLAVAAVIGREFDLQTLEAVAGMTEEMVLATVEEAVRVAVLQDQSRPGSVRYRFAHAFFRQTLYQEIITPRRLRLHQQVARALEAQYAARLDEHASELAEHFAQSTDAADLAKAVAYSQRAARRAGAVYAYSEAVRLLEQALAVQDVVDPDDGAQRLRLLMALASALGSAGEFQRVADTVAPAAFALAEALGDRERAARICQQALGALSFMGGTTTAAYWTWAERADLYVEPGTLQRVGTDFALAMALGLAGRFGEGDRIIRATVDAVRRQADPRMLFFIAWNDGLRMVPQRAAEDLALSEETLRLPRDGVRAREVGLALCSAAMHLLNAGQRQRWEAVTQDVAALAEHSHDAALRNVQTADRVVLLMLDGRLTDTVAVVSEQLEHVGNGLGPYGAGLARALLLLGRYDIATDRGFRDAVVDWPCVEAGDVRLQAIQAPSESARAELRNVLAVALSDANRGAVPSGLLLYLLETALLLGDAESAARLAEELRPATVWAAGGFGMVSPARLLGEAAALAGDRDAARGYYLQALDSLGAIGFRPELALTRLSLAALLATDDDAAEQAQAAEHLTAVIPEFEAMAMAPALARARALEEQLTQGGQASADTPAAEDTLPAGVGATGPGQSVFISYGSANRATAQALAERLGSAGVAVWLDQHSIAGGASWDAAIVEGIKQSAVVAVLVSPESMQSRNVRQELRLAMQYDKPVLPLLLAPTVYPAEVEYVLAGRQWVEVLERADDDWFAAVLAAVRRLGEAAT
ncbi:MAG: AAA family ATPase, partial [Dehalococcoidia bacterium]